MGNQHRSNSLLFGSILYAVVGGCADRKKETHIDNKGSTIVNGTKVKYTQLAEDTGNTMRAIIGDITTLKVDAIVNAANAPLIRGGGVDNAIHEAAGSELEDACKQLGGCPPGDAKITEAYKIQNVQRIIHTVGPIIKKGSTVSDSDRKILRSCYEKCLDLAEQNKLKSIAFPSISTGVYNFPKEEACQIAIETVRGWLNKHPNTIDKVLFCCFLKEDKAYYDNHMKVIRTIATSAT